MSDIQLQIDGREVNAKTGMTILEAARSAEISIPTLCHHEKLAPFGACRLCIVEILAGDDENAEPKLPKLPKLVVSCVAPVEEGQVVRTRSEKIDRLRRTLLDLMLTHAPHAPRLKELAREYGAKADRFQKDASFCIHCGLCVRYCDEIKKSNAIGFIDRGIRKEIAFIPEIAARECDDCKECFPLCPTSYLQAAYVLANSLALHAHRSQEKENGISAVESEKSDTEFNQGESACRESGAAFVPPGS